MKESFTYEEACELCESLIVENLRLLASVRKYLDKVKGYKGQRVNLKLTLAASKTDLLRRVDCYGAYIKGARTVMLRLRDIGYIEEPHPKDWGKVTKEDKLGNKADIDLYLESPRNMDWFLEGSHDKRIKFERDNKGKAIGAKSSFVKKVVKYEEI